MGQKVNPIGYRTGVMLGWKSRWYAPKEEFSSLLLEDKKIREFIKKHPTRNYAAAGIDRIEIERTRDEVKVLMMVARPGLIIGKKGRRIAREDAMKHVAGYACYNDGSVRDYQRHTSQFGPGKNFVGTGGFGPWMVTTDEQKDIVRQTLTTRVNGEVKQQATIDMLIHDIPQIIAYISIFCPLEPGDVIVTGTPGGVGAARTPPEFMKACDVVEVEITGVGLLRHTIKEA